ncbi:MAG TPA: DUF192 domain-containing protein [Actinomycetota bacterium]|nr:DUF192 domain-containing protein [Actinomycetota bacterium]
MRHALVLAVVVGLAACSQVRAAPPGTRGLPRQLPQGGLSIEGEGRQKLGLQVRIAETDQSRQDGLMGVTRLSDQEGMAFLFTSPVSEPFWMENTLIPLDIAFWDTQGRVVKILTMVPCRADPCHLYSPGVNYVGAVEMNAGLLRRSGVSPGDSVKLTR